MMKTDDFLPEGSYGTLPSVRQALHSLEGLRRAQDEGRILEAPALRCTGCPATRSSIGPPISPCPPWASTASPWPCWH